MIAVPAIDLRGGHAVQLVGGDPGAERIRVPDPVTVARRWTDAGFGELHIVDLDAALGLGENRAIISALVAASIVPCQVGGGIRDEEAIESLLEAGARRVIVGTRAIDDPTWLTRTAARWPDRLVVAADVRDGRVVTRGWTRVTDIRAESLVEALSELDLAGVLVTDVTREGRQEGVDRALFATIAARAAHPVQAAGGITTVEDLRALRDAGIARAVLGMAIYTGRLDPITTAREFGA